MCFELFKDDASDPMNYFRDISTFGGCTAGPAAAIENMAIIEEEGLLDNTLKMGERMIDNLNALSEKHAVIGQVRGKGPVSVVPNWWQIAQQKTLQKKKLVQAVVADCAAQGVLIGATNRSIPGYNNTLCFSPALIATPDDIDEITDAVDRSLTKVFG